MWSKISSALRPREGNDSDTDRSDSPSTSHSPPPDPFRINATTYYTHQTPPTPPPGAHSRTASREEDLIWSLRTQLALQQEMCAQFQTDLNARDELVATLTNRVETLDDENDKRKGAVRSWKKKAADLEKLCRHLREETDNSRRESMERSVMDVASEEALRRLHDQIARLQREKNDVEVERDALAQTAEQSRAQIQQLQKDSATKEVTIVQLNRQLDQVKEDIGGLNIALESKQQELELVKRKHGARTSVGPNPGRTNAVPCTVGKPAVQPSKVLRNSSVANRPSSPPHHHRLRFS